MRKVLLGIALGLAVTVTAAPTLYQAFTYYLPILAAAEPAAPASGVVVFAEDRGDRGLLAWIDAQGYDKYAQDSIGHSHVAWAEPAGGGTGTTAPIVKGMTVTHEGTTVANPAPASTSFYTATTRVTSLSTNTAGSAAGWRAGQLRYWAGNGTDLGGYYCTFRWCNESAAASNRGLVGMTAATGARSNQDPTSDTNIVGAFWNSADSAISLGGNDGSGTATKTTTCNSTDFPPRTNNQCFHLEITQKKNTARVTLYLKRIDTTGITPCTATITASADMPSATTFLAPRIHQQITSTTTTTLGMLKMHCEQDY